jgi:hypothetical protein
MAHVANRAHAPGSKLGTLHHAGVELDVTFQVQAGPDPSVEERLVLELADGGHSRGESALADERPTCREGPLDRRLPLRAFGDRHWTSAAVDDQSRACHLV